VKFVEGTIPPPTIMDEDPARRRPRARGLPALLPVRGHRGDHGPGRAAARGSTRFQILGAGPGVGGLGVRIDAGIAKELVKVSLPREEHHQTSDLEQLAAAVGVAPDSVGTSVLAGLPQALRDDPAGVTVTTFTSGSTSGSAGAGRTVVAVERGDTTAMKFGLAIDVGTTSVVTNPDRARIGRAARVGVEPESPGRLRRRFSCRASPSLSFNPINLRKLHTRIVGC